MVMGDGLNLGLNMHNNLDILQKFSYKTQILENLFKQLLNSYVAKRNIFSQQNFDEKCTIPTF